MVCFKNNYKNNIDKIYLTHQELIVNVKNKFNKLKMKDVLKHPNWDMGKKLLSIHNFN